MHIVLIAQVCLQKKDRDRLPDEYRDLYLNLTAQLDVGRDQSVAMIEHHAVVLQNPICPSGVKAESDFSFVLKDTPGHAFKATSFSH